MVPQGKDLMNEVCYGTVLVVHTNNGGETRSRIMRYEYKSKINKLVK